MNARKNHLEIHAGIGSSFLFVHSLGQKLRNLYVFYLICHPPPPPEPPQCICTYIYL